MSNPENQEMGRFFRLVEIPNNVYSGQLPRMAVPRGARELAATVDGALP